MRTKLFGCMLIITSFFIIHSTSYSSTKLINATPDSTLLITFGRCAEIKGQPSCSSVVTTQKALYGQPYTDSTDMRVDVKKAELNLKDGQRIEKIYNNNYEKFGDCYTKNKQGASTITFKIRKGDDTVSCSVTP